MNRPLPMTRGRLLALLLGVPVALALTDSTFYYENPDLEASLDLNQLEEVEYDDETATGHSVAGRVLRLRAHNHVFEFTLDMAISKQWEAALPPRRLDQARAV